VLLFSLICSCPEKRVRSNSFFPPKSLSAKKKGKKGAVSSPSSSLPRGGRDAWSLSSFSFFFERGRRSRLPSFPLFHSKRKKEKGDFTTISSPLSLSSGRKEEGKKLRGLFPPSLLLLSLFSSGPLIKRNSRIVLRGARLAAKGPRSRGALPFDFV